MPAGQGPGVPAGRLRIGFQVWGQAVGWPALAATARQIEALGFDSIFGNDHFLPAAGPGVADADAPAGPVLEGWLTAAGFATATDRIPVGVLVSGAGYRNAGLLVKQATTLDHLSGGRAILGLGAGWHEREHRAFGFDYASLADRIARLDEQSHAIRRLLDGEEVTVGGRFVRMDRARNLPPPVRGRLPLLIGASGERRALRIVARDADIWNGEGDPPTFAHKSAVLDGWCREAGRDPWTIRRTAGVPPIHIRSTRAEAVRSLDATLQASGLVPSAARETAEASPLADALPNVLAVLDAYASAGADEVIVDWPAPFDDETLEVLAAATGRAGR